MKLIDMFYASFALVFVAAVLAIFLSWRERVGRRGREPRAMLRLPHAQAMEIFGQTELRKALKGLDLVEDGNSVRLSEREGHYLEAVRRGELWSAALHTGRFWSAQSFDAEGTTEYEEREVRKSRAAGPMGAFAKRTRPDEALSTGQVKALFVAYLLGIEYPLGSGGA